MLFWRVPPPLPSRCGKGSERTTTKTKERLSRLPAKTTSQRRTTRQGLPLAHRRTTRQGLWFWYLKGGPSQRIYATSRGPQSTRDYFIKPLLPVLLDRDEGLLPLLQDWAKHELHDPLLVNVRRLTELEEADARVQQEVKHQREPPDDLHEKTATALANEDAHGDGPAAGRVALPALEG